MNSLTVRNSMTTSSGNGVSAQNYRYGGKATLEHIGKGVYMFYHSAKTGKCYAKSYVWCNVTHVWHEDTILHESDNPQDILEFKDKLIRLAIENKNMPARGIEYMATHPLIAAPTPVMQLGNGG